MHLSREKQGDEPQATKGETGVAGWETAPAVVEGMGVGLGTYFPGNEDVGQGPRGRFTAGY